MAEIFEIKNRIESLHKINDITYAMQIITITRLKKIMSQANRVKDSFASIKMMLDIIFHQKKYTPAHFLLEKSRLPQSPVLVLVFSNRGFCGNFNQSILDKAQAFCFEKKLDFHQIQKIFIGKKAVSFKVHQENPESIELFLPEKDVVSAQEVDAIFNRLVPYILAGRPIYLCYGVFKSIVTYHFEVVPYFPMDLNLFQKQTNQSEPSDSQRLYFLEPNYKVVFEQLITHYFYVQLYSFLLDSSCSEFSQRFMIMKNANENIQELQDDLVLELNKERQGQITQELSEIISTFKTLKKGESA